MKKLIFAMLAASVALFFFSCLKDDDMSQFSQEEMLMEQIANAGNIEMLGVGDVPSAITGYVQQNHAPFEMEMAFYAPQLGYEVMMENGLCLFFGTNGNHLNHNGMNGNMGNHQGGMNQEGFNPCMVGDTLNASDLPQAALDYIAANYSGNTVVTVVLKPSGKLGVQLSGGTVLMFNPDGSFIQVWSGQGNGNHGGMMGGQGSGNHGGMMGGQGSGNHGGMMSGHQGGMGNHQGSNEVCWGGTGISVANLPAAITGYVSDNYPDATVVHAMQTYSGKYFLRLSNSVRLVFDGNGNILFDSGN